MPPLTAPTPHAPPNRTPARPIHFVHQGSAQEVRHLPPTTTVLQWLREAAHCTGTKEGCAEGDCGACTVVLGQLDPTAPQGLRLRSVNACIQLLPMIDGQALFTVEDVNALNGHRLHPCQQAMVDCHGSQCGFCTPGFVMSLWHLYQQQEQAPSRTELADALSGNLCRCTGYRPILDAGLQMFEAPRAGLDLAPVADQLRELANKRAWDAASTVAPTQAAPTHAAADHWVYEAPDAAVPGQTQRFVAPLTLSALAHWREALPQATLLAGSTDIGLWVTKQFRPLGDIIHLGQVRELQGIELESTAAGTQSLLIGAGVSLEAAWSALAGHIPALREIWLRFASPPVRHAGTLGGNVANGSPIGDSAPVLLALGAELVLRRGPDTRTLPLHDFYLGYMKNALQVGEFVQAICVPLPALAGSSGEQGHEQEHQQVREQMRAYKISKRRDSDISAVCAGLWLQLRGAQIIDARVAFGGMAATARRSALAEAALIGQPWSEATLHQAQAALAADFTPMSDMRASANYRLRVAQNLLHRFWLETRTAAPLPAPQVQVWPALP